MINVHNKKETLLNDPNFNPTLLLSQDRCMANDSKQFITFKRFTQYITFLENNKNDNPHFYEIIYNNSNYPVYMYYDLDKILSLDTDIDIIENYEEYCYTLINVFTKKLKNFISEFYNHDINFIIGNNFHVGLTQFNIKKPKLSIHIKINIVMKNSIEMKIFRDNFVSFLLSNIHTSIEDREYFFTYANPKNNYESIIDPSVYSNFRSFRLLYSSKITKNLTISPFKSSLLIKDHLLNVHLENPQNIINVKLTDKNISIDGIYKDITIKTLTKQKNYNIKNTNNTDKIIGSICTDTIHEIEELLKNNIEIANLLKCKPKFNFNLFITENIFRFSIDKTVEHICPYANKIHNNNRSYFDYYKNKNIVTYGCFNDKCKNTDKLISFNVNDNFDALSKLNEFNSNYTLHSKNNIIQWDEVYNNNEMNNYPLKPIVAIGAKMGVGKTNCLINNFIKKHCSDPNTKCLFITYQIVLSKKYEEELRDYGFINYLDRKNERTITDNKVIICLDSLVKIKTMNFDYIFIDEVMSVLLHFNSPLIKDITILSLKFELLLLQCNRIYLLDTCIDNSIVYNLVKYLEDKKNIKTYWIKNTFIRETNRNAKIFVNKTIKYKSTLENSCFEYITKALNENKNIVVSSSTKSFTELLKIYLAEKLPDVKTIVYNSATDTSVTHTDSINPNIVWNKYQCLVYSPTISAGISFTSNHFDELICFVDNSLYTPTVDITLQQMFRVRNLTNGNMTIYVNNTKNNFDFKDYPVTENEIDYWLERNTTNINSYFPNETLSITKAVNAKLEDDEIVYDKNVMSYSILKSILYNKNKSLHFYSDLIVNTLTTDYNIKCETTNFEPVKDKIDYANELMKQYKDKIKVDVEFDTKYLITFNEYEDIQYKENLTEEEKQKKWTFDCAINMWKMFSINKVDKEFFDNYIGHYSKCEKYIEIYFKYLRFNDLNNSIEETIGKFKNKIEDMKNSADYNLALYRYRVNKYYEKLIEAQKLLTFINPDKIKEQNRETFNTNINKYFNSISNDKFLEIKKLFDILRSNKITLIKNLDFKHKLIIAKNILKDCFEINIEPKNKHKTCNLYYNFEKWSILSNKYGIIEFE